MILVIQVKFAFKCVILVKLVFLVNMVIQVMVVNIGYFGKSANSGESSDFDDSRDTSEICVQICYFGEIGVSRKYGDSGDDYEYCLFWRI